MSTAAGSRGARYRDIERYLRDLIAAGRPDDPLPTEADLCTRFAVSRMTARQALQNLSNEGLVYRHRGRGTFVAVQPMHRRPGVFLSFTEEMARRGKRASSRLLSAGVEPARPEEVADLQLAEGSDVVRIVRVREADGIPIAIEEAALPTRWANVLEADLEGGSLHTALQDRGLEVGLATGTITARLARASEVSLLDLPPHAALLVELRLLTDRDGMPFERTESRYVADRYVIDVQHVHP